MALFTRALNLRLSVGEFVDTNNADKIDIFVSIDDTIDNGS